MWWLKPLDIMTWGRVKQGSFMPLDSKVNYLYFIYSQKELKLNLKGQLEDIKMDTTVKFLSSNKEHIEIGFFLGSLLDYCNF